MSEPLPSSYRLRWLFFLVAAGLLAIDQGSKEWAQQVLSHHGAISVIDGWFRLTYVRNTGVAFGFAAGQSTLLLLLTPAIVLLGLWWARLLDWRRTEVNLVGGALIAGAIGNWIDRLRHGYVVDFFDFTGIGYPWVFNVADSSIVLSVTWIFLRQWGLASHLPNPFRDVKDAPENPLTPETSSHARHQSHPSEPR